MAPSLAELEQVMTEIVPFLDPMNPAMRDTVEAVLSYTNTAHGRSAFRKTNVVERLLLLVPVNSSE